MGGGGGQEEKSYKMGRKKIGFEIICCIVGSSVSFLLQF